MAPNKVVKKKTKDEAGLTAKARIRVYRDRAAARIQPEKQQQFDEYVPSQTEQSEKHLAKLTADGTELVTNILVAADARKLKTQELRKLRSIGPEAKELDPDLHQLCSQIPDEKKKLIQEQEQQLKRRLEDFEEDRKREGNEMDLLIQTMQEEISSLKKHCNESLDAINRSLGGEWSDLLRASKTKWEQLSMEQSNKERELLLHRMKMLEEHADLLDRLKVEMAEERNRIKMKLMADVQRLQQDLTRQKATNLVNLEKQKHNTQIMKQYMREYFSTKAQLLRKKYRLTDICNDLRKKIAMQEAENQKNIQLLTNKYRRLMKRKKVTKKRMKQSAKLDAMRYKKIWLMNEDKAKKMVCRAVDLDQLIREHVLGLTWSPPPVPFMDPNDTCALKLESMDASEVKEYWDGIANIIPESKLKVWGVLKDGLKKYQAALTKRSELLTKTQQLKEENEELRKLLNINT